MAKNILRTKYQNDLWLHQPQELEYQLSNSEWEMLSVHQEDIERLSSELNFILEKEFNPNRIQEFEIKKGDVLFVFHEQENLMGYFIMDTKFRCVYLKLENVELEIPVSGEFDMLGNVPANYWEVVKIPKLSFYFDLQGIFSKIKWEKVKEQAQNYLIGDFEYQKRRIHLYVPINESNQDATKLAIGLNLQSQILFYPRDPEQILESEPTRFFASLNSDLYIHHEEEQEDLILDYELD
jgi:hypothetical protein